MTKVFIGGSRRISRLGADVRQRLDRIMARRLLVLIGDANGTDKAVQSYFRTKGYDLVEVFCAGRVCRNNVGGWPVRTIAADGARRDFKFFATKDRVMAGESSVGFMIWDGQSIGTLLNVLRLASLGKKVVLYIAPRKEFVDLRTETDLQQLLGSCGPGIRERVEREAEKEQQPDIESGRAHRL